MFFRHIDLRISEGFSLQVMKHKSYEGPSANEDSSEDPLSPNPRYSLRDLLEEELKPFTKDQYCTDCFKEATFSVKSFICRAPTVMVNIYIY